MGEGQLPQVVTSSMCTWQQAEVDIGNEEHYLLERERGGETEVRGRGRGMGCLTDDT